MRSTKFTVSSHNFVFTVTVMNKETTTIPSSPNRLSLLSYVMNGGDECHYQYQYQRKSSHGEAVVFVGRSSVRIRCLLAGLSVIILFVCFAKVQFLADLTDLNNARTSQTSHTSHNPSPDVAATEGGVTNESGTTPLLVVPNVLLAGAQKAGTSAVSNWLFFGGHKVCSAQALEDEPEYYQKEVHFFETDQRYNRGPEFYASHFTHCDSSHLIMDATPGYEFTATRIRDFYQSPNLNLTTAGSSNLKVMMILREPVSRELSWYNHKKDIYLEEKYHNPESQNYWADVGNKEMNGTVFSFDEYVDHVLLNRETKTTNARGEQVHGPLRRGLYSFHLEQWFKWLPREQLLVLSYHELQSDPTTFKTRIEDFLGLEHQPQDEIDKANTHSSPAKTVLPSCQSRDRLAAIFQPWNEELYQLLEQNPGPPMEQRPFPKFEAEACKD